MLLRPSHLRHQLLSLLSDDPYAGPHTAIVLLPHGQILASVSTSSSDWLGGDSVNGIENGNGLNGDDDMDDATMGVGDISLASGEEGEVEEEEPYMEIAERNRLLLGLASSQWSSSNAEVLSGSGLRDVKVECELGQILLTPFSLPMSPPTLTPLHPEQSHHRSTPLPSRHSAYSSSGNASHGGGAVAAAGQDDGEDSEERETFLLALNGVRGLKWDVLEKKAKQFLADCNIS